MGKLNKDRQNKAITLYKSGLSSNDVAARLDVSGSAIRKLLATHNVPRRSSCKLSPTAEIDLCKRYAEGEPAKTLAPEHNISVSLVGHILKRHGYTPRNMSEIHRTYQCDHSFFDRIDTEDKAYWLGFIAADGYISSGETGSRALTLSLATADRDQLERFKIALNSTHPIHDKAGTTPQGNPHYFSRFYIASPQLTDDLAVYGVTSRKTWTLRWPTMDKHLYPHFLRGYTDGDGGFYIRQTFDPKYRRNGRGWLAIRYSLSGNESFLLDAQNSLMTNCNLNRVKLLTPNPGTKFRVLTYSGRLQIARIFHYLYDNARIYMPRKHKELAELFAN